MSESILVVDDEREIADLVEVYLKNDGYTVYKFYNGTDALRCIEEADISLAILDVMLPDMDGFHICRKIREKYLGITLDKAGRLEDLINEFFEIARFNLSDIPLQYGKVNLTRLFEQMVYEFQPLLDEKQLHCRLELADNVILRCDADKLERAFDNLLRNAVIYSYAGTEILIRMQVRQDYTQVRQEGMSAGAQGRTQERQERMSTVKQGSQPGAKVVLDFVNHGDTIPQEKLGRIFEQFYRVDSSRSSSLGGAGLGLAIAKQIIEKHQGTITAQSANEVIRFHVELPMSQ